MRNRTACLSLIALAVLCISPDPLTQAQKTSARAPSVRRPVQTATTVKAEMILGRLNPARTVAGDQISLRLNEDVKSNGKAVFKKGTVIRGIVRDVRQIDAIGSAQSLIGIEWIVPAPLTPDTSELMVALQAAAYMSLPTPGAESLPEPAVRESASLEAACGGCVVSSAAAVPHDFAVRPNGRTNAALMSMPSIVLVDQRMASALKSDFGLPADQQIYRTGRGDMITLTGERQTVELLSFMSNDTMIVSLEKSFDIGTGAEMQLLVGVQRK
jgi:hypothetical protein